MVSYCITLYYLNIAGKKEKFKRGEFHHSIEWWFASKPLINVWNSCVLKIRLGGERSEHAIGLLTDGPPRPILTVPLVLKIKN